MSSINVTLVERQSGERKSAKILSGLSASDLLLVEREWSVLRSEIAQQLLEAGVSRKDWPESMHWDWARKAPALQLLECSGFAVVSDKKWQGVGMIRNATYTCRIPEARGKPMIYVDFLEIAPWNWTISQVAREGQFKLVGSLLMWKAVQQSLDEGFKGRVGLHALPRAEAFYRKLGFVEVGRDPKKQNLMYLELNEEQATRFLSEGGTHGSAN